MVISRTDYGNIIFARVLGIKPGTRSASDSLTIVTLEDTKTLKQYKMLCWNDKFRRNRLSNRARRLNPGEMITARVKFDVGDEQKCTALEVKKTGLYQTALDGKKRYVLCGEVKKVNQGEGVFSVMISAYLPDMQKAFWYQVCWWRSSAKKVRDKVQKGDKICVCCTDMIEKVYNGFEYRELTGAYFEKLG